jgi:alkylation response protein AidB-like acyl-CoA dehydrogenase
MMVLNNAFEHALAFLREEVAPRAQELDQNPETVRLVLAEMSRRDLMALRRPEAYGGPAISEGEFRLFQEAAARASGTFAFLQTQHQSAVGMIASGRNEALKAEYLPQMGDGRKTVGIGFSQLRRPGPPIMTATPVADGYLLRGHVPWVTGWSYYEEFLLGATLPGGEALFCVVPLRTSEGVTVSEPMRLAAMDAAMTVTVDFEAFFVPDERIVMTKPAGWIRDNDQINIALQGSFAMGCAQAGLDVIRTNGEKRQNPQIRAVFVALSDELTQCRIRAEELRSQISEETTPERLALRAWQIDLCYRCAQAAVVSSSGGANSLAHPAQRIYREALVFSVSAQTTDIMVATLDRLVRR